MCNGNQSSKRRKTCSIGAKGLVVEVLWLEGYLRRQGLLQVPDQYCYVYLSISHQRFVGGLLTQRTNQHKYHHDSFSEGPPPLKWAIEGLLFYTFRMKEATGPPL
ncbi:hypothetical protein NHX12_009849 [Muraenolepis orangiensis]|uniref:Uncharacterized protein n=1 Tax=Muraenolepis orangiensis TaxID=630683 RepID=A0A9Q0I7U3_9TELE|nr:hypothetical protein NHX12_009849 [Muraenolepis orangiensis]